MDNRSDERKAGAEDGASSGSDRRRVLGMLPIATKDGVMAFFDEGSEHATLRVVHAWLQVEQAGVVRAVPMVEEDGDARGVVVGLIEAPAQDGYLGVQTHHSRFALGAPFHALCAARAQARKAAN